MQEMEEVFILIFLAIITIDHSLQGKGTKEWDGLGIEYPNWN